MPAEPLTVACLCAAWCRTCDAYREVFDAAVGELRAAGHAVSARWIDIEDEADLVGDLDVETFPTLLVAAADQIRFYGPLEPQPETLRRVFQAAVTVDAGVPKASNDASLQALCSRLRQG